MNMVVSTNLSHPDKVNNDHSKHEDRKDCQLVDPEIKRSGSFGAHFVSLT
jgi:hypothetical protein